MASFVTASCVRSYVCRARLVFISLHSPPPWRGERDDVFVLYSYVYRYSVCMRTVSGPTNISGLRSTLELVGGFFFHLEDDESDPKHYFSCLDL